MAAILFLVGSRLEKPEVIDHMLNVEKCPRKPQYGMASGQKYEIRFWNGNEVVGPKNDQGCGA